MKDKPRTVSEKQNVKGLMQLAQAFIVSLGGNNELEEKHV